MKPLFDLRVPAVTTIDISAYTNKKISLGVARLDVIHPIISGNKLFKLYYFIEAALATEHKTILSFGGAFSNHLVATAYACQLTGLRCIGIVRGEKPDSFSHTLRACEEYGMHLHFVSREAYDHKEDSDYLTNLTNQFGPHTLVPEGGYHSNGAKGASLIMNEIAALNPTHICTAIGTATTIAGLVRNVSPAQTIIGIPVLKNMTDIADRIQYLNGNTNTKPVIFDNYHFGGYAKKDQSLIDFMNVLYHSNQLPTDFVYTGKMMYAIIDKIKAGYFEDGDNIICLHTGGLQGNDSLPKGTLVF